MSCWPVFVRFPYLDVCLLSPSATTFFAAFRQQTISFIGVVLVQSLMSNDFLSHRLIQLNFVCSFDRLFVLLFFYPFGFRPCVCCTLYGFSPLSLSLSGCFIRLLFIAMLVSIQCFICELECRPSEGRFFVSFRYSWLSIIHKRIFSFHFLSKNA